MSSAKGKFDEKGIETHMKTKLFGKFKSEFSMILAKKKLVLAGTIDFGPILNKLIGKVEKALSLMLFMPKFPKLKLPKIRFQQLRQDYMRFMQNENASTDKYHKIKTNYESRNKFFSKFKKSNKKLFSIEKSTFKLIKIKTKLEFNVTFYCTIMGKKKVIKILYDPKNQAKTMISFAKAAVKAVLF